MDNPTPVARQTETTKHRHRTLVEGRHLDPISGGWIVPEVVLGQRSVGERPERVLDAERWWRGSGGSGGEADEGLYWCLCWAFVGV